MEKNVRKYIIIPDFKPLFAMRECFGQTDGPLDKPTPVPLDIIGKLLRQDGRDALTIMEVKNPREGTSEPVRLTLDNYTLPYEEILNGAKMEKTATAPITKPAEPVKPEVDKGVANAIKDMINGTTPPVEDTAPVVEEPTEEPNDTNAEAEVSEEPQAEGNEEPTAEESDTIVVDGGLTVGTPEPVGESITETATSADPFAGMTKKQRREARKAMGLNGQNQTESENA